MITIFKKRIKACRCHRIFTIMELYDSVTQGVKKLDKRHLNVYVCGITPQSECHIGHLIHYLRVDILLRSMEYFGYKLNVVRNCTDINDEIFQQCGRAYHLHMEHVAKYYSKFVHQMETLNVRSPTSEPRVSQYVQDIATAVAQLLREKRAYWDGDGNVRFRVIKHINSGYKYPLMSNSSEKKDFCIWSTAVDSTNMAFVVDGLSMGRPTWNSGCVVMSHHLCNGEADIQIGAVDLITSHHHDNGDAIHKALYGSGMASTYVHFGNVMNSDKTKMSKSNGFDLSAEVALAVYDPNQIRMYCMLQPWDKNISFDESAMNRAKYSCQKVSAFLYMNTDHATARDDVGRIYMLSILASVKETVDGHLKRMEWNHVIVQIEIFIDIIRRYFIKIKGERGAVEESKKYVEDLMCALGFAFKHREVVFLKDLYTNVKQLAIENRDALKELHKESPELLEKIKGSKWSVGLNVCDQIRAQLIKIGIHMDIF